MKFSIGSFCLIVTVIECVIVISLLLMIGHCYNEIKAIAGSEALSYSFLYRLLSLLGVSLFPMLND